MSRTIQLFYWVPVLFLMIYMATFYVVLDREVDRFNNDMLQKQVNYASDAAVLEAITTNSDAQLDYSNNRVEVDPDVCKREFVMTMLGNLGVSVTDKTIENFENTAIMSLQVCMYDGVYTYYNDRYAVRDIASGALHNGFKLVSTPKIPYFYEPVTEPNVQYALTFDNDMAYKLYVQPSEDVVDKYNIKINTVPVPISTVTRDRQLTVINNTVSEYMNYALVKSYRNDSIIKSYKIPAFASEVSGAQPVRDVNVIGIVDLASYGVTSDYIVMGVGGSRITKGDPVVTYVRNDVRYWNYTSKCGDLSLLTDVKTYDTEYQAVIADHAVFDLKGRE